MKLVCPGKGSSIIQMWRLITGTCTLLGLVNPSKWEWHAEWDKLKQWITCKRQRGGSLRAQIMVCRLMRTRSFSELGTYRQTIHQIIMEHFVYPFSSMSHAGKHFQLVVRSPRLDTHSGRRYFWPHFTTKNDWFWYDLMRLNAICEDREPMDNPFRYCQLHLDLRFAAI